MKIIGAKYDNLMSTPIGYGIQSLFAQMKVNFQVMEHKGDQVPLKLQLSPTIMPIIESSFQGGN